MPKETDDFRTRPLHRVGDLSLEMIDSYVQAGRRMRAEAFGHMIRAAWQAIRRRVARPAHPPSIQAGAAPNM